MKRIINIAPLRREPDDLPLAYRMVAEGRRRPVNWFWPAMEIVALVAVCLLGVSLVALWRF